MREAKKPIISFAANCVYWGGALLMWYVWYRWFNSVVDKSDVVSASLLLQILAMVLLTFLWRDVVGLIFR